MYEKALAERVSILILEFENDCEENFEAQSQYHGDQKTAY